MLEQYKIRKQFHRTQGWRYQSWYAPDVMKFATWGLVGWRAVEVLSWWRSGTEWNNFVRFWGSASIDWTHLMQFVICKEYHQDGHWLAPEPQCAQSMTEHLQCQWFMFAWILCGIGHIPDAEWETKSLGPYHSSTVYEYITVFMKHKSPKPNGSHNRLLGVWRCTATH